MALRDEGSDLLYTSGGQRIVYVGSEDGSLYALNATTGRLKWRYVPGGPIDSSPAVVNGIVYFGSGDQKLYALDAITGTLKWSYTTGGSLNSSPAVANGVVYVGSADASLYALNATTGIRKWSYVTGGAIDSSPAVGASGLVYIGSDLLYALDIATGTLRWSYSADGCAIEVAPAVANGLVYFATDGDLAGWVCQSFNNLLAVNATSGALVWSTFLGGPNGTTNSAPIVANDVLYISTEAFDHEADCSFRMGWDAYNATTGSRLWGNGPSNTCYTYGPPATPVVVNGVFYIGSAVGDNTFYTFHLPGMTP